MKKLFFTLLIALLLSTTNFSQNATKVDEFGYIYCGDRIRLHNIYHNEIATTPQTKIYIIYYEGLREFTRWNSKTKKYEEILEPPTFGSALNGAKEIPLYLKMVYKVPSNRFILIDGGFQERFIMEIWNVPDGAEVPKPTPTLTRKDIKFAKGKPRPTRKLACCYDDC